MSNLSTIINENLNNIKGAAFHYKFYSIALFVLSGFMILFGIPLLIFFGLGLIYIGLGILYIFVSLNIYRASDAAKSLISSPDLTQDDYNTKSMKIINETRKFFKMLNIIIIVGLALSIISGIVFAFMIPSIIKQFETSSKSFGVENVDGKMQKNKFDSNTKTICGDENCPLTENSISNSKNRTDKKTNPFNVSTDDGSMTVDDKGNMKITDKDGKVTTITSDGVLSSDEK